MMTKNLMADSKFQDVSGLSCTSKSLPGVRLSHYLPVSSADKL